MELETLEKELAPGSVVSFYFDKRIDRSLFTDALRAKIEGLIAELGELVIGTLASDGIHIHATTVESSADLRECTAGISDTEELFFGPFPARDNDGIDAVTIALPDSDGILRNHPH